MPYYQNYCLTKVIVLAEYDREKRNEIVAHEHGNCSENPMFDETFKFKADCQGDILEALVGSDGWKSSTWPHTKYVEPAF